MDIKNKIKPLIIIFLCVFSGLFIYFLTSSIGEYQNQVEEADKFKQKVKTEMITITAPDGVKINAYFMISHENWAKNDHSVPFVIGCHGMSNNPFQLTNLAYTLVKRGYAVLLPEARGHGSNSGTTYFGGKEPWDIISLMDYIEQNEIFSSVNISASGIIGTSLGGLYATSTYVFESLGKGRLNALVSLAGPINVTRAVELYTSTPDALGNTNFLNNLTGTNDKNPITYINSTFPKNVALWHGTTDNTVDFRCSSEFFAIMNETGTRSDIEFQIFEGAGHEISGNSNAYRYAIAWVEKYILLNNTQPNDVIIYDGTLGSGHAQQFWNHLQTSCLLLIPILVFIVYLVKPSLFLTLTDEEMKDLALKHGNNSSPPSKEDKRNIFLIFLGIQFTAGLTGLYIVNDDILTELMIPAVMNTIFVGYLYKFKFTEELRIWCKQSLNWKVSLTWIAAIIISFSIYFAVPSMTTVKENTLTFGVRYMWFIPYVIVMLGLLFITTIFLARYFVSNNEIKKIRKTGPMISGVLVMLTALLFLFWNLSANLFGIPLGTLIVLGVFVLLPIADLFFQLLEKTAKSIIIGPLMIGLLVGLFVFSNYGIFFFF
jgi:uncharacterized protein